MKTVITQEIDGYTIVTGVGDPVIDAVATRLNVEKLTADDPDRIALSKASEDAGKKIKEYLIANSRKGKKRVVNGVRIGGVSEKQVKALWDDFQKTMDSVKEFRAKLNEKCTELYKRNIEYFEPKFGEFIVTDEIGQRYLTLLQARKNQQVCFYDGEKFVSDLRGQHYWIKKDGKWERGVIEKLGQEYPDGCETVETMPDETKQEIIEQLDTDRICDLSPGEKQKELEKQKNIALDRAASMKSRLEIEGDDQALEKSREWHRLETERLEQRYQ
jgi:hypothetical protein